MIRPTIKQAHELCDSLGVRAVIIIALDAESVSMASYGETKPECRQTGYTADRIMEGIESGEIPVWAPVRT